MRTRLIAAAALLFSTAAFAEDHFTIFVSDPGHQTARTTTFESTGGTAATPVTQERSEWTGGVGIAFSHSWSMHWSTEGSIEYDRHFVTGTKFVGALPVTARQRVTTTPADLMMRFHFPNDSRWTPYIGAGAHYVGGPGIQRVTLNSISNPNGTVPVTVTQGYDDRFAGQVSAGTSFRITPRFGLQFDLKRLVGVEKVSYDPQTRGSFGVNWSF